MYSSQNNNSQQKKITCKVQIGYKKLTMGLHSYKDIKQAHLKSRACQQSTEYQKNRQCTFQPRLSAKKSVQVPQNRRSLKKFLQDQDKFSTSKRMKIQQLRQQISKQAQEQFKGKPSIDPFSHQLSTQMSLKTNQKVFQRLSKQKRITHQVFECEEMFSPKICPKSKSLKRQKDVSNLLYKDAQRRRQKQQFKFQQLLKKGFAPQINSNTNNLVIRKIYSQFVDMVQQQHISPLFAITVLSQIFNVDFNPNKSRQQQELCQKILSYIADTRTETVDAQVLWNFIQTIVNGHLVSSSFTEQQQTSIIQLFSYFYSHRLTKTRRNLTPQKCSFKPKTLRSSEKLAQNHRQRTLSGINQYLQNEKVNIEITNNSVKIEDLFIMEHMRKNAQNQRKRIQRQNSEVEQCSFRPNLELSYNSNVQSQKPTRKKVNLVVPRTTKTQQLQMKVRIRQKQQEIKNKQNRDTVKDVYQKARTNPQGLNQRMHTSSTNKSRQVLTPKPEVKVKNIQKSVMRVALARKNRELVNALNDRGYPNVQNWNSFRKSLKRDLEKSSQKFIKGYNSIQNCNSTFLKSSTLLMTDKQYLS